MQQLAAIVGRLPWVFAAGDVTDSHDKQIVIAAGAGANAALGQGNRPMIATQSKHDRVISFKSAVF